ncbi:MAG: hypothetical protein HQL26_05300 [Candidatus Omnitrophica bacterium]|nr:hypothetical protein [Candidatus Omnitrophota bacterium]
MSPCDPKTGVCEVPQSSSSPASSCASKCACGSESCCTDPIACQTKMLTCAFWEAKKAVMVDILKLKIQKSCGKKMEMAADAIVEAMEVKKDSMIAMAKAKEEFMNKLKSMCKE